MHRRPDELSQRHPAQNRLDYQRRRGSLDPEAPHRVVLPSLLERRRRIDQALYAVIMEAYVHGVSTRNVDDLVGALGVDTGISKSHVSRICQGIDGEIARFRERTLTHTTFPYVFLDATFTDPNYTTPGGTIEIVHGE